jgi:hypothetical protein
MRRAIPLAAAIALAVPAAASAEAVPVPVAKHAIRSWWRDRYQPRISCRERRLGDLCVLRIPARYFDCSPSCDGISGFDDKLVWVSRTGGRVEVRSLGDRLDVSVG